MARPKSKIERDKFNTSLDKRLVEWLREENESSGIPINRIVENALWEYISKKKGQS